VTIDGREVGGKSSSSYELSSFARHGAGDPQVGTTINSFYFYGKDFSLKHEFVPQYMRNKQLFGIYIKKY